MWARAAKHLPHQRPHVCRQGRHAAAVAARRHLCWHGVRGRAGLPLPPLLLRRRRRRRRRRRCLRLRQRCCRLPSILPLLRLLLLLLILLSRLLLLRLVPAVACGIGAGRGWAAAGLRRGARPRAAPHLTQHAPPALEIVGLRRALRRVLRAQHVPLVHIEVRALLGEGGGV